MSTNDWYTGARRKILIDNHLDDWLPGYEKYDSKRISDTIIASGFEAGMIYARCHVGTCYWDASEGPKHAGLGDHDQIGEICAYLQQAGKHFILYYSTIYDKKLWDAHPDWRIVSPEGEDTHMFGENSRYKQVCPNSPYREYTVRALEEIAQKYPIEGAFLDMTFWTAVCHCEHCQKAWAEASGGLAIPKKNWDSPIWKRFVGWRYAVMTDFIRACVNALHKYRPGIVVSYQCPNQIHNGWLRGDDINAADSGGIPSHDVYYPSGHIHLSLQPRLFQATSPIHPFDVFISRPVVGLRDMPSMKPYIHMLAETCSVLANGGAIIYIDQIHPDGGLYQDHWDQFTKLNAEIARREEFTGGEPVPHAAVYFSQDTRDFFGQDNFEDRYMGEFVGACKALQEEHIVFDIITPRNLGDLGKYKVVVLPNTACMSKREVDAFKDFVKNGGGLVGSYEVSSGNEWNEIYPQPALGEVFGYRRLGDTSSFTDTYFQVAEGSHPVAEGLYRQRPITCMQKQVLVESNGESESLASIVFPYTEWTPNRYISIHNNPPGVMTSRPAILANRYGKGRAVYFASQIGAMYATSSYWEARTLIANAVRWAAGTPAPVEIEAPVCIELTAWDQAEKSRRVAHLVNVQSDITRTVSMKGDFGSSSRENLHVIHDILPVYEIALRFQVPAGKQVKQVVMQPEGISLPVQIEAGWGEVKVPKVHVHEAIVIEWK